MTTGAIVRLWRVAVWLGILCAGLVAGCDAGLCAQAPAAGCTVDDQTGVLAIRGYSFRSYASEGKSCLKVFHEGKQVYGADEDGGTFTLGKVGDPESPGGVAPGTDITGRGNPDVMVSYFSGGAHCCFDLRVFELEPQFSLLAKIGLGNADESGFKRDAKDGRYRLGTADNTFAYWHTDFAESPLTPILLEAADDGKGGVRFRLATEAMRKAAPTEEQWRRTDLHTAKAAFLPGEAFEGYYAGADLWRVMLDRIYGGQDAWAWKTLDAAWPEKKRGKEVFLKDFCRTLHMSPYWDDLKPAITSAPPVCEQVFNQPLRKSHQ